MNEWLRVISEPVNPIRVSLSFPGAEYLLPIVILCGLSVLATALWILAVEKHVSSQGRHP